MRTAMNTMWVMLLSAMLLVGCGGGGGGGGASSVSTSSFPLKNGLANSIATGGTTYYTVSGSCSGTANSIDALPAATTFEGVAAQSALTTENMRFTNCAPLSVASTTTSYYDASYTPLGSAITGNHYGVFLTPASIPALVKVGDTGTIGTQTLYTDSTKTVLAGRDVLSYVIEPDTANSAIVNMTTKSYDAANLLTYTGQSRYRILVSGAMTPVSVDVQYSGASTLHLLLTVVAPPAVAVSGSWGIATLVSNDVFPQFAGAPITGDSVGNMFLSSPLMTTPTQAVLAGYQKPVGLNWGAQYALSVPKTTSVAYLSNYVQPQLRADSAGNAVAAWVDVDQTAPSNRNFTSHVYVRNYDKTTGWGTPVLMQSNPLEYATSVNLTVQPDGVAWMVWTERTVTDPVFSTNDQFALFAAKYTPLVGWGIPEKVTANYLDAAAGVNFPQGKMLGRIATDNAGNPTVLWTADSLALNSTSKTTGTWGAPNVVAAARVTPGSVNYVNDFDFAIDASGNAIAVWRWLDATGLINVIYSNRYIPTTGWGAVTTMPTVTNQNSMNPKLAMDSSGNAFLLWSEFDGSSATAIWAMRFDRTLGWQTPTIISSPPNALFEDSTSPQIAFDAIGNAVAIWTKYDAVLNKTVIRANRFNAISGWGVDSTISNGVGVVNNPQLAVSSGGRATAVWEQDDIGNLSFKIWSNDFMP